MTKILVTGATGFIGRHLIPALLERGHEVTAMVRPGAGTGRKDAALRRFAELDGKLSLVEGDVFDGAALEKACKDIASVAHLVGIIKEHGAMTFERIHAEGTKNVVSAAKRAGVKRIMHVSALGASPRSKSRYHTSKFEGELIVKQSGLPYAILRPGIVLGREDQFANLFARSMTLVPVQPVPPLFRRAMLQPVHIDDLVRCMVLALEGKGVGEVHHICGPEAVSLERFIRLIAEIGHRHLVRLPCPDGLFRLLALLLGKLTSLPLGKDQLAMLEETAPADHLPAEKAFGVKFLPCEEALRRTLMVPL